MRHPPTCDKHLWAGWQPIMQRLPDGDDVFCYWRRECITCGHTEDYGHAEVPHEDTA